MTNAMSAPTTTKIGMQITISDTSSVRFHNCNGDTSEFTATFVVQT
jgi:hypothetical protein